MSSNSHNPSRIIILGSGTSTGIPVIGCECEVCHSSDTRDSRMRASALVEVDGQRLLIDCGPDYRRQFLDIAPLRPDAVLLTHIHYDHVGGIDDLRPITFSHPLSLYCRPDVAEALRRSMPYCFGTNLYPGVPQISLVEISPDHPFYVGPTPVIPIPVMHHSLPIIGFRIGNFAYITDAKTVPASTFELLRGVDTLVVNALRLNPHHSHFSLSEALEFISRVNPRRAFLTHISHQMPTHARLARILPPGVFPASDGLVIEP